LRRFIAGDPLRGISALAIATFHCILFAPAYVSPGPAGGAPWHGRPVTLASHLFWAMLFIFFVLSGYLITRPFVRWVITGAKRPDTREYARNRALRIVPGFWFVCLLALVLHGVHGNSTRQVIALFSFGQVFTHGEAGSPTIFVDQGWTISAEALFYIAVPFVALALARALPQRARPATRAAWIVAFAAILYGVSLWARGLGTTAWDDRLPHTILFAFMPGIALAAIEPFALERVRGLPFMRVVPTVMLVLGVLSMYHVALAAQPVYAGFRVSLGAGLIVGGALLRQWARGDCWRFLDNRVLHWIGERSYSIYILHFIAQREVFKFADKQGMQPGSKSLIILIISTTAVTVAASAVTYRFVEQPFLRRRHKSQTMSDAGSTTDRAREPLEPFRAPEPALADRG